MKKLSIRNITLWLMILTLLWSSQGQGFVWCLVADGTAHLESSLESHCASETPPLPADKDQVVTFDAGDDACNPCFDLSATFDTLQQRPLSTCDSDAPPLFSTSVHPQWLGIDLVRHLVNNLILDAPPRVATTLLVQRTTVLLI